MFGEECVDFSDGKNISVTVDRKTVHICCETRVRSFYPVTLIHRMMYLLLYSLLVFFFLLFVIDFLSSP